MSTVPCYGAGKVFTLAQREEYSAVRPCIEAFDASTGEREWISYEWFITYLADPAPEIYCVSETTLCTRANRAEYPWGGGNYWTFYRTSDGELTEECGNPEDEPWCGQRLDWSNSNDMQTRPVSYNNILRWLSWYFYHADDVTGGEATFLADLRLNPDQPSGISWALPEGLLGVAKDGSRLVMRNSSISDISVVWSVTWVGTVGNTSVAAGEGKIVVLSSGGMLSVLAAGGGASLGSVQLPVLATTPPSLASNVVLFGDSNGFVRAYDVNTLTEAWSVRLSASAIIGEILVTSTGIYAVAADGTMGRIASGTSDCKVFSAGYAQNGHQTTGPGGVNTLSRNMVFTVQDLSIPFAGLSVNLLRTYNSQSAETNGRVSSAGTVGSGLGHDYDGTPVDSALGPGWTHSYQVTILPIYDGATGVTLYAETRGDGRQYGYSAKTDGKIEGPPGANETMDIGGDGAIKLRKKHGLERSFDPHGNLLKIEDPNGNKLFLTHTPAGAFNASAPGYRLISVAYLPSSSGTIEPVPTTVTVYLDYDNYARLKEVVFPDPSGSGTKKLTYSYNSDGLLDYVHGPGSGTAQYQASYEYYGGRMIHKHDPRAPSGEKDLAYDYDAYGKVISVRAGQSGKTLASYTAIADFSGKHHTLVARSGKSGLQVTEYIYKSCGVLEEVRDTQAKSARYDWDANLDQIYLIDALGRTTSWYHDSLGNVTKAVDSKGNYVTYEYNPTYNQITRKVDAEGNETLYEYDGYGNLVKTIQKLKPYGSESATDFLTLHAYDIRGLRISTTESNGSMTGYEYDARGNLVAVVQVLKQSDNSSTSYVTRYEYDFLGRRNAVVDPKGVRTEYEYDLENRLVQLRSGILPSATPLSVISYEYDTLNRLTKETDAAGRFTAYGYDERDQLVSISNNLGYTTTHSYDDIGNRVKTVDPNGNETNYEYDVLNRLIRVIDAEEGTAEYSYDAVGNLKQVRDPNGQFTLYDYDELNRLVRVTHPDATTEEFSYDRVGNRLSRRDGRGILTSYEYDSLYRLRRTSYANDPTGTPEVKLRYDSVGNRIQAETSVDGQPYLTDYQYDSLDRMTGESIKAGGTGLASRSFTYDSVGNRLSQEVDAPAVAGIEHRIDYDYDPLDRIKTVTSRGQSAGYDYDLSGNLVRMNYPNRVESQRAYDMASRLTELRNARLPSQAALNYFKYGYDKMNNRTFMRDMTGLHKYSYDKLYRLAKTDYPRYPDQTYYYDAAGNRSDLYVVGKSPQTYTYSSTNSLEQVTEGQKQTTYEWDAAGNLRSQEVSISGVLQGKMQYAFDGANRLAGATLSSGQGLVYGYDQDGHRVYRKEGAEKTWFVFDGLSVVMELDGNRKAVAALVPGLSKTNLSYHIPVTEYYLFDGLGSVVMLTDVLGNPIQMYQYDVFGGTQNLKRDPFNKYRFVGLAHDDSLGLTYMNARWYDPESGRFTSPDLYPGGIGVPKSLNRYQYAGNNPANDTDVTGLLTDSVAIGVFPGVSETSNVTGKEYEENQDTSQNKGERPLTISERERYEEAVQRLREDGLSDEANAIEEALRNGEVAVDSSLADEESARTRNPYRIQEICDSKLRINPRAIGKDGNLDELEKTLAHEAQHIRQLYHSWWSPYYATFGGAEAEDEAYGVEIGIQARQNERRQRRSR